MRRAGLRSGESVAGAWSRVELEAGDIVPSDEMLDDLTEAVLSREDIVRYIHGSHGESGPQVRDRICGYLDELRTTQRYPIYRALKHPLYPDSPQDRPP